MFRLICKKCNSYVDLSKIGTDLAVNGVARLMSDADIEIDTVGSDGEIAIRCNKCDNEIEEA
jgi:hypothetical protein